MEHSLRHLPFLVGGGIGVTTLALGDVCLPLCLSGQGGKARHSLVPVEVVWSFDNHKQAVAEDVYLHFLDAYTSDALTNLAPMVLTVVSLTILPDEFRVIL